MTQASVTPLIIDVRSPGEFATGHVRGSLNIPLDRFADDIAKTVPDKSAPVILCCASGGRSGMACSFMQQMGYHIANASAFDSVISVSIEGVSFVMVTPSEAIVATVNPSCNWLAMNTCRAPMSRHIQTNATSPT